MLVVCHYSAAVGLPQISIGLGEEDSHALGGPRTQRAVACAFVWDEFRMTSGEFNSNENSQQARPSGCGGENGVRCIDSEVFLEALRCVVVSAAGAMPGGWGALTAR